MGFNPNNTQSIIQHMNTGLILGGGGSAINTQRSVVLQATQGQGSVKGKLTALDEMVSTLGDELNYHKREVQQLRSEKETLESVLNTKTGDMRSSLTAELKKVEDEMRRNYSH